MSLQLNALTGHPHAEPKVMVTAGDCIMRVLLVTYVLRGQKSQVTIDSVIPEVAVIVHSHRRATTKETALTTQDGVRP